jgi:hypothetical protein
MSWIRRRIPADSFANQTVAVLIGVSKYKTLRSLGSPALDADKIAAALEDKNGCAIPSTRVHVCPREMTTSREGMIEFIEKATQDVTSRDMLLFFFAGHGIARGEMTYICSAEATDETLETSSLSGAELATLLARNSPRGLLAIVDCCDGAGITENAPDLFYHTQGSDFHILLSSSLLGQPSWEMVDGKGTLFAQRLTDVIAGHVSVGEEVGLTTFSELFRYLGQQIPEDLASLHGEMPRQDVFFAGSYPLDPVIFVHKGLTLAQISVRVGRYSKKYIERLFIRALTITSVALFFATGTTLDFLEHSQYAIQTSTGRLQILKGYPGVPIFGFPHPIWTFDFGGEALEDASVLRKGQPLVAPLGQSILPLITSELTPEFKAKFLYWTFQKNAARTVLLDVVQDRDGFYFLNAPGREREVLDLFGRLANADDETVLEGIRASAVRKDIKIAAGLGLAQIDPESGLDNALDLTQSDANQLLAYLNQLHSPCTSQMATLFGMFLNSTKFELYRANIIDNAIRLKCSLDERDLLVTIKRGDAWIAGFIGLYISIVNQQHYVKALQQELSHLDKNSEDAAHLLLTLYYIEPGSCSIWAVRFLRSTNTDVRAAAAALLLERCPKTIEQVVLRIQRDISAVVVFAKYHLMSEAELNVWSSNLDNMLGEGKTDRLLHAYQYLQPISHPDTLLDIVSHSDDLVIKLEGLQVLRGTHANLDLHPESFVTSEQPVQSEVYKQYLSLHRADGFNLLLSRLDDSTANFVEARIIALDLSDPELQRIRSFRAATPVGNYRITAILCAKGTAEDALHLLHSEDPDVRTIAVQAAGYRSDLESILKQLRDIRGDFPDPASQDLERELAMRHEILDELAKLDSRSLQWRLRLFWAAHKERTAAGLQDYLSPRTENLWSPSEVLDTPKMLIIKRSFSFSGDDTKKEKNLGFSGLAQ